MAATNGADRLSTSAAVTRIVNESATLPETHLDALEETLTERTCP